MRAARTNIGWLMPLALTLTGCWVHKTQLAETQPLAPPIVNTPPPTPTPTQSNVPPQVVAVPQAQQPQPEPQQTAPPPEEPKPAKRASRHPKTETSKPAEQPAQQPGGVSAIGQLSSGSSGDQRYQTEQSISATDQGLRQIKRGLNDQEQKTATQIREFLKQARAALTAGDVDGAHTLAVKASVLLGELNR
jgi:hypothetical protein